MNKKAKVIEVARDLFTKYGYKKVSMDEIAKTAGVTKKTLYTYFKDKEDMFSYFVLEELENMKKEFEYNASNNISFLELVTSSIYKMLLYKKNSNLITEIQREVSQNDEKAISFLQTIEEGIIKHIEDSINKQISLGNIKACNANLVAFVIYKVCVAVMLEYDGKIEAEKISKEIVLILKNGLFN